MITVIKNYQGRTGNQHVLNIVEVLLHVWVRNLGGLVIPRARSKIEVGRCSNAGFLLRKLILSYHNKEALKFTIDPYYENLNRIL